MRMVMPRPLVADHILWCYSVARGSLYFTNCEVYLRYLRWSVVHWMAAFFHMIMYCDTLDDVQAFFSTCLVSNSDADNLWRIQTAAWCTKAPLVVWIRWLWPGSLLDSNPLPWKNTMRLSMLQRPGAQKNKSIQSILDVKSLRSTRTK